MKTTNFREVPLSEIINLPVYPVADILPKLERTASQREEGKTKTLTLAELADSIIEHGQHEAIVLYNGQILDGRNRRWACEMAAKALGQSTDEFMVLVEDFEGTDEEADEFVFTAGLDRRDLEPTQRATSAAKFEFNPATRASFERMKEKANLVRASNSPNHRTDTNGLSIDETTNVNELLSRRFRVAVGYIKDARRELKAEIAAREAAERAAQRAEEYELEAEEAFEEVKEAAAAGDEDRAREANTRANNAANHKVEEREKAAAKLTEAAKKANLIESLHEGRKKLSEVRKDRKEEGRDERELAISKAVQKFNDGYNRVMEAGPFLLKEGRLNDQENVRLKYQEICNKFSHLEEVEGARQPQFYFEPESSQTTHLIRWASEVRTRLGGIDRIIQEHDVRAQDVASVPEFEDTLGRILLFLAEVEEIINT